MEIIGGTDNRRLIACYNVTTSHNGGSSLPTFWMKDQDEDDFHGIDIGEHFFKTDDVDCGNDHHEI